MKKYLLLGSCRVVNTVAYEAADAIIVNRNDLWFTHYLQEHIQKIKHLFCGERIPKDNKELFVRYEQENHYGNHANLKVGESIESGSVALETSEPSGVLNVVVEIPTNRYIKLPIDGKIFWGHTTNIDLIRASPFNQSGGNSSDEDFLKLMQDFERVVFEAIISSSVAESVNFVYVPHTPFVELQGGGWGISEQRVHIFDLIKSHCLRSDLMNNGLVSRCFLDVKEMIDENGGVDFMLEDQNHYSVEGRKVAFTYLDSLTL